MPDTPIFIPSGVLADPLDADDVIRVDRSGKTMYTRVEEFASDPAFTGQYAALGLRPANTDTSYWSVPAISTPTSTNGVIPTQGLCFLVPFVVASPVTVTSMSVDVTTAGESGSLLRVGIYADSPSGEHDMSTISLEADFGTAAASATGIKTVAGSVALSRGRYWAAVAVQVCPTTAPQLRGWFDNHIVPGVPGSNTLFSAFTRGIGAIRASAVTGALPDPPTTFDSSGLSHDRRTPQIVIGVAA